MPMSLRTVVQSAMRSLASSFSPSLDSRGLTVARLKSKPYSPPRLTVVSVLVSRPVLASTAKHRTAPASGVFVPDINTEVANDGADFLLPFPRAEMRLASIGTAAAIAFAALASAKQSPLNTDASISPGCGNLCMDRRCAGLNEQACLCQYRGALRIPECLMANCDTEGAYGAMRAFDAYCRERRGGWSFEG
ncbi:hypothetical protein EV122DRAFT_255371 [Schizophyllum commune]